MELEDNLHEVAKYGEKNVSAIDMQLNVSIENSVIKSISKKWKDMKIEGLPNNLLKLYDKILFPERKNITTLILASLIVDNNGKIHDKVFQQVISKYSSIIKNEKINNYDIYRYVRYLASL